MPIPQGDNPYKFDHFLNWRSASTFLGWSFGGPVGGVIGAVLGDSAIRRVVGDMVLAPVIRGMRNVGAAGAAAGLGPKITTALNAAAVDGLRTKLDMPHNTPESVAASAYAGYTEAGMTDADAAPLAALQGKKAQVLAEAVRETDKHDPVSRLRLARKLDAVSDLRSIGSRLRESKPTPQDLEVLQKLFPNPYRALSAAAAERLSEDDGRLSPETRKALEMLAGQQDQLFARMDTIRAAGQPRQQQQGRAPAMTRPGSPRIARQLATTTQRLQGA